MLHEACTKCTGDQTMFDLISKAHALLGHHIQGLMQNPSFVPLGPNEHYNNWTPKTNDWQPSSNAGDNWTGPNNPFGPKIPLGAHGAFGSAPPTASGWSSGECNFNGQAQCGQGPAPKVFVGANNPYGVMAPPKSGVGSGIPWHPEGGNLLPTGNVSNPWQQEVYH